MYPNPIFRTETETANLAFARERGFGVLAIGTETGPMVGHVPFLITGDQLGLHLVRSNPIARALAKGPLPARVAVSGGDSYVSPDWYEIPDQVPTWNYIAVHLTGPLELRPNDELRDLIDAQSAFFETRIKGKAPWTSDKMTPEVMARMMRQIVACRMQIDKVEGTWKLNQNKPDEVRLRAADKVATEGQGMDLARLAMAMREA